MEITNFNTFENSLVIIGGIYIFKIMLDKGIHWGWALLALIIFSGTLIKK